MVGLPSLQQQQRRQQMRFGCECAAAGRFVLHMSKRAMLVMRVPALLLQPSAPPPHTHAALSPPLGLLPPT